MNVYKALVEKLRESEDVLLDYTNPLVKEILEKLDECIVSAKYCVDVKSGEMSLNVVFSDDSSHLVLYEDDSNSMECEIVKKLYKQALWDKLTMDVYEGML